MTVDIVTTLRREPFYHPTSRINSFGRPQMGFEMTSFNLIAADEIERLRDHVRALEIEIERYRIQCVRISDLERMLEVQDTQLEHAQKALRILEGAHNGRNAAT